MPGRDWPMQFRFQYVGLDYVHNLLLLRLCERKIRRPPGVLIADKTPVKPRDKVENVNERRYEVNKPHPPKPVLLVSLGRVKRADRRSDQVSRNAEQHQRDRIDPV